MFLLQVKVTDPCNLPNLSSGSQLLLSNVFCFVLIPRTSLFQKYVKSAFYRENVCLVVLFCIAVLSLSNVFLTRVCEWKIAEMLESSLKNKPQRHFRRNILTCRQQKSKSNHGVWGAPIKMFPTVCAKTVSCLFREST